MSSARTVVDFLNEGAIARCGVNGDLGDELGNRSPEANLAALRAALAPEDIVRVDGPRS